MLYSSAELARRWANISTRLAAADLDAVVVMGGPATPELIYCTDYQYRGGRAFFLLTRTGDVRLVLLGPFGLALPRPAEPWHPTTGTSEIVYGAMDPAPAPAGVIDWLKSHDVSRIAVNVPPNAPLVDGLTAALPHAKVVSWAGELLELRFVKGDEELGVVRRSVAIADETFSKLSDFVQPGRTVDRVVREVHRFAIDRGVDLARDAYKGSLNIIFRHTPGGVNGYSEDESPLETGDSFTLEITPRVHGYYTQLTIPVSVGPPGPELQRLYDCVIRSREAGLAEVRPGSDSAAAAKAMLAVIEAEGFEPVNTDIGHLLGIDLTEPRLGLDHVVEFEAGMVLVFHPMIRSAAAKIFMRGDTYLVTDSGPVRLNESSLDFPQV